MSTNEHMGSWRSHAPHGLVSQSTCFLHFLVIRKKLVCSNGYQENIIKSRLLSLFSYASKGTTLSLPGLYGAVMWSISFLSAIIVTV